MPLSVKICGITTLEDARYAAAAGADLLGFVQYSESRRFVEAGYAGAIIDWISGPKSVGVFVNEALDVVNNAADTAGFDYVQLHGNESPGYCRQMAHPVIKAFSVKADTNAGALRTRMEPYLEVAEYFLLDTYHPVLRGGTGQTFRWDVAAQLSSEFPIILAGGIGAHNALTAIATVNPAGIDCSSWLEYAPGRKDFGKIADLFDAVSHLQP